MGNWPPLNPVIDPAVESLVRSHTHDVAVADHGDLAGVTKSQHHSHYYLCSVRMSGVQSIPTAAWTNILFDITVSDAYDMHDTGSNTDRITVPAATAGLPHIASGTVLFDTGTGNRRLAVQAIVTGGGSGGIPGIQSAQLGSSVQIYLDATGMFLFPDAGDYFVLRVYQDTGGNLNIASGHFQVAAFGTKQ